MNDKQDLRNVIRMAIGRTSHDLQGRSLALNLAGSSGVLADGVFKTSTNAD